MKNEKWRMKNEEWRIQVELSSFFSILASNLVRCVLRVAASLLRTHCLRLTLTHIVWFLRRTRENCASNKNTKAIINKNPTIPPCLLTSLSSVFRRRPERQRPSVCVLTIHFIRLISPMSLIKILRSTSPCLRSLYSPCFAEGQSTSDHQFSASLLRTSWHHEQ